MSFSNQQFSEQEMEEFRRRAQLYARRARRFVVLGLVGLIALWALSGFYIVQPGQQGVVLLFGRHISNSSPGFNYHIPWPVQSAIVVDMQSIRRAELGFRSDAPADQRRVLEEALMLTRDENIVEVGLLVQYQVKDAAAFAFRVQDPDTVLRSASEVALRGVVGQMPIDDVITTQRAEVQDRTRLALEQLLEEYNSGILITDVRLQVADAPDQVRDAFQEVVRARENREQLVNEAQDYREDVVPRARGEAQQILQQAIGYREERVRQARGESDRFLAILAEYRSAPEVTRERMYIETVERVLAKVDKVLMPDGQNGVLPFLQLRGNTPTPIQSAPVPPQPQPQPQPQPPQQQQPQAQPKPSATQPQPSQKP